MITRAVSRPIDFGAPGDGTGRRIGLHSRDGSGLNDQGGQEPLRIRPCPSRRLALWVCAVHGSAVAASALLPVPWSWRLGLIALLAVSLALQLWGRIWCGAPWSIREAIWSERGWELQFPSGPARPARLSPSSYVGVALVILNFRRDGWRFPSMTLTTDSIDADLLRRLRARLRRAGALDPGAERSA